MKNKIILLAVLSIVQSLKAQDYIERKDSSKLKVKIIEQSPQGIRYVLWKNHNADTMNIKLSDIAAITYQTMPQKNPFNDTTLRNVYKSIANDKSDDAFWINTDLGFINSGIAYDLSGNYFHKDMLFCAEIMDVTNDPGDANDRSLSSHKRNNSFSFLFGKAYFLDINNEVSVDFTIGLSYNIITNTIVVGTIYYPAFIFPATTAPIDSIYTNHSIGIPLSIKLHLPTSTAIGFDIGIKADINKGYSFIAATLGLRF